MLPELELSPGGLPGTHPVCVKRCPVDGIFTLESGLCQGTGQQYNYKGEPHVLKGEGCAQSVESPLGHGPLPLQGRV